MKKTVSALIAALLLFVVLTVGTAVVTTGAEITDTVSLSAESVSNIPIITSVSTVNGGLKISFSSYPGAYAYRVFIRRDDNSGWKKVGDTTALTYTHQNLIAYKEYLYTVRALDKNGNFISGYDKSGYAFTYWPVPVLESASNVYAGAKVTWKAVNGAKNYRVYVKSVANPDWKRIGDTDKTSFTYTAAESGTTYTFTVRVYDKENNTPLSYFDRTGVKTAYVAAPSITSFSPIEGGTKIKWRTVNGAAKYRVFLRKPDDSGWKKIGDTTGTSYNHTGLTANTEYKYTVRCLDSYGNFISGYNSAGWLNRYLAPPIMELTDSGEGSAAFSWEGSEYAAAYNVYRKAFGESWIVMGVTYDTNFTDSNFEPDTVYTYTVRSMGSDGRLISYFTNNNTYYCNGALANGKLQAGGKTLNFENGHLCQGYVTLDGKIYYYDSNGNLLKNCIVGSAAEGFKFAGEDGVIVSNGRLAVTSQGKDWNVIDGKAYQVVTAKDHCLHSALKLVAQITTSEMSNREKLRKCYDFLLKNCSEYRPRTPHYRGTDWPEIYADDIFTNRGGNCYSHSSALGYMAKAIGYKSIILYNNGFHGFVEIDGLYYDPQWQRYSTEYNYFALPRKQVTDIDYYQETIFCANGDSWMRMVI